MAKNGMTRSQATRILLALGLRGEEAVGPAFRRAAFREGVTLGVRALREQLQGKVTDAITKALGSMEAYVAELGEE